MNEKNLSQLKALYVEDEPIIAIDGQMILESLGIVNVAVCYSLAEAEATYGAHGKFDLALLDINLGGGDTSLELARRLERDGTPIVFASGYNPDEKIISDFEAPLVVKPFDERSLREAVLSVLQNA